MFSIMIVMVPPLSAAVPLCEVFISSFLQKSQHTPWYLWSPMQCGGTLQVGLRPKEMYLSMLLFMIGWVVCPYTKQIIHPQVELKAGKRMTTACCVHVCSHISSPMSVFQLFHLFISLAGARNNFFCRGSIHFL